MECWAHQGTAKIAQKYKLVNDAAKLHWIAQSLSPRPERLVICVSDPAAIRHLQGRSWQGQAIEEMGVELMVIDLRAEVVASDHRRPEEAVPLTGPTGNWSIEAHRGELLTP